MSPASQDEGSLGHISEDSYDTKNHTITIQTRGRQRERQSDLTSIGNTTNKVTVKVIKKMKNKKILPETQVQTSAYVVTDNTKANKLPIKGKIKKCPNTPNKASSQETKTKSENKSTKDHNPTQSVQRIPVKKEEEGKDEDEDDQERRPQRSHTQSQETIPGGGGSIVGSISYTASVISLNLAVSSSFKCRIVLSQSSIICSLCCSFSFCSSLSCSNALLCSLSVLALA